MRFCQKEWCIDLAFCQVTLICSYNVPTQISRFRQREQTCGTSTVVYRLFSLKSIWCLKWMLIKKLSESCPPFKKCILILCSRCWKTFIFRFDTFSGWILNIELNLLLRLRQKYNTLGVLSDSTSVWIFFFKEENKTSTYYYLLWVIIQDCISYVVTVFECVY